jgi:hypothetical protein
MDDELFAEMVFYYALTVVLLCLAWMFLHFGIYEMREAWKAMKGRAWRWPEGDIYGPGDEPHHRAKKDTCNRCNVKRR